MSKGKTVRVRITIEKDPEVRTVTVRFGNRWIRAKIRNEGGWTADENIRLATDPAFLSRKISEAHKRGETWIKMAPGTPWGQLLPGKGLAI